MDRRIGAVAGVAGVLAAVLLVAVLDGTRPDGTPTEPGGTTPTGEVPPPGPTPASPPATTAASLVVWARGGLRPEAADRIAALPAVTATAFVRTATLGLVGSRDADGATVDELADGYRVPVAVAAVTPDDLAATLAGTDGDAVRVLRPGHVLLSETSSRLRRLGVGGTLDLATLTGLEVVGVVPDATVRRAEVVLHVDDAAAAGIDDDGSVVVRYRTVEDGPDAAAMETAIRASLPDDEPVRVVPGDGSYRAPLVLPLLEVKERFGELAYRPRPGVREIDADPAFVDEHIVSAEVPLLGTVRCHRDIVDDLRGALEEIVANGLGGAIDPDRYGGCYYPRLIAADRDGLSRHSWGIAIDINVDLSLPGLGEPPPPAVVAAFERHGFRWGGDFLQPDNHHFEWVGPTVSAGDGSRYSGSEGSPAS